MISILNLHIITHYKSTHTLKFVFMVRRYARRCDSLHSYIYSYHYITYSRYYFNAWCLQVITFRIYNIFSNQNKQIKNTHVNITLLECIQLVQ